jgi:hypothetical protein
MDKILLRNRPKLEVIISKKTFEIIDEAYPKNSNVYYFKDIKSFFFEERKTNLSTSILSFIIGAFIGVSGDNFKTQANVVINLKGAKLKIWLNDTEEKAIQHFSRVLDFHVKTFTG